MLNKIIAFLGVLIGVIFGASALKRKGASDERSQHNEQIIKQNEEDAKAKAEFNDLTDESKSDWMLDQLEKRRAKTGG